MLGQAQSQPRPHTGHVSNEPADAHPPPMLPGQKEVFHIVTIDKLIAFNLVLFILILGFDISFWLGSNPSEPFSFAVILMVSMIFSSIASLAYAPVLEIISNLTTNKIESLRMGATILFTDLSIALIGTLFSIPLLVNVSAIIIGVQLIIILLGALINLPKETKIEDKIVNPNQLKEILGGVASTITIINFIVWIGLLIIRFV
jgi:hypothetical protein